MGVGYNTLFVTISQDGTKAYAVNFRTSPLASNVTSIDTSTLNILPGSPISTGIESQMIALTPDGSQGWVPNFNSPAPSSDVTVIDLTTSLTLATIPVQRRPIWAAITPDGSEAYVANNFTGTVSVLSTSTFMDVVPPISVGITPELTAITPDGSEVYVPNADSDDVSVISTATHTVTHTIPVGMNPFFIAISHDGTRAFVANNGSDDVTVIDIATHTVLAPSIPVGDSPRQLAITPDNSKVYVANEGDAFVSVIDNSGPMPFFLTNIATSNESNWVAFSGITPFISASGFQVSNRFLAQTDLVNVILLSDPSNNPDIVAYEFYRNEALTDLAGSVSSAPPIRFEDHRRKKGVAYTYYIVSVDIDGDRQLQGVFTLNP